MSVEFGIAEVRDDPAPLLDRESVADCPYYVVEPCHYRDDGSCRCNDPEEQARMIREGEYAPADFADFTAESCCGNCGDSNCGCF